MISGKLYTKDGVDVAYEHFKKGSDTVIVICPGFFNSKKNRWMRRIADAVSTKYDAIIFDFRGHGGSGGKFSWSAKEHLDLDAVLNYAKVCGYKRIGILAFSLGSAASVIACSKRDDIDSMVLVSCPMSFWRINYHFWEPEMWSDLKDNIECGWEGKGARVTILLIPKPKPIEYIKKIRNTPIFFIHGDSDWVIKDSHSRELYAAAKTHRKLEVIKNGLHAERLIQQYPEKMKNLIGGWFEETLSQ